MHPDIMFPFGDIQSHVLVVGPVDGNFLSVYVSSPASLAGEGEDQHLIGVKVHMACDGVVVDGHVFKDICPAGIDCFYVSVHGLGVDLDAVTVHGTGKLEFQSAVMDLPGVLAQMEDMLTRAGLVGIGPESVTVLYII